MQDPVVRYDAFKLPPGEESDDHDEALICFFPTPVESPLFPLKTVTAVTCRCLITTSFL
jgi:hypothetical protein